MYNILHKIAWTSFIIHFFSVWRKWKTNFTMMMDSKFHISFKFKLEKLTYTFLLDPVCLNIISGCFTSDTICLRKKVSAVSIMLFCVLLFNNDDKFLILFFLVRGKKLYIFSTPNQLIKFHCATGIRCITNTCCTY